MIFRFFDYVFYRVYKGYAEFKETAPEGTAISVLSLLQFLNILTLYCLYELITHTHIDIHKYWAAALLLVLMVFNYFRYIRKDYFEVLKKKWINETQQQKVIAWIYIIISVIACLGLVIYLSEIR